MREPFEIRYLPRRKQEKGTDWNLYFFYNNMFVSFEKFQLSGWNFSKELIVCFTIAHLSVTKVATSGRNVQWTLWILSHLRLFLHLMDRELTITNDKILGFPTLTHRRHLPQNLLNYLSIYWTTSESTELPENLLNYLRIYWTTWEFTELPENLLNYLGNYWTTWKFYWTTWEITELPENFTELPQIFTELPGFLQVQIIVLPGPAEVY